MKHRGLIIMAHAGGLSVNEATEKLAKLKISKEEIERVYNSIDKDTSIELSIAAADSVPLDDDKIPSGVKDKLSLIAIKELGKCFDDDTEN